jgi:hypothetical protein
MSTTVQRFEEVFTPVQEYEGIVTTVLGDLFRARIYNIRQPGKYSVVELPLRSLSYANLVCVRQGATFRWLVGYRQAGHAYKMESHFQFRKYEFSDEDLRLAEEKALSEARWID